MLPRSGTIEDNGMIELNISFLSATGGRTTEHPFTNELILVKHPARTQVQGR